MNENKIQQTDLTNFEKNPEYIEIETQPTDMDLDFNRVGGKIKIKKSLYIKLSKLYGLYSFNWYITAGGFLKYFKGNEWHLERINL